MLHFQGFGLSTEMCSQLRMLLLELLLVLHVLQSYVLLLLL